MRVVSVSLPDGGYEIRIGGAVAVDVPDLLGGMGPVGRLVVVRVGAGSLRTVCGVPWMVTWLLSLIPLRMR